MMKNGMTWALSKTTFAYHCRQFECDHFLIETGRWLGRISILLLLLEQHQPLPYLTPDPVCAVNLTTPGASHAYIHHVSFGRELKLCCVFRKLENVQTAGDFRVWELKPFIVFFSNSSVLYQVSSVVDHYCLHVFSMLNLESTTTFFVLNVLYKPKSNRSYDK